MNSAIERLLGLRVKDVMSRNVVEIQPEESMQAAALRFAEYEISGAPVVDSKGHCVGILTATDFVDRVARQEPTDFTLVKKNSEGAYHLEGTNDDLVASHMSPVVQHISEDATIIQAARMMCTEHIHRLVVLDKDLLPVGVMSSLDLAAAMVAVIEE